MKWSTEEDAEERVNGRGECIVTKMAKAGNGQNAEDFQEIKEEARGEKMKSLLSESSEKREGHFYEHIMTEFSFGPPIKKLLLI